MTRRCGRRRSRATTASRPPRSTGSASRSARSPAILRSRRARSAVVIAGGLGLRLGTPPAFGLRRALRLQGPVRAMMSAIPVKLITHPQPGLSAPRLPSPRSIHEPIEEIMRTAPVIPVLVIEDAQRRRGAGRGAGRRRPAGARSDAADSCRARRDPAHEAVSGAIVGAGPSLNDGAVRRGDRRRAAEFIVSPGLTEPLAQGDRQATCRSSPESPLPATSCAGSTWARPLQILPGGSLGRDRRR